MKQKTLIEGFWDRANIALKEANLNKKQAAERIGCNRKTLLGKDGTLSPVYLARFCVVTGADANWLLGIRGERI